MGKSSTQRVREYRKRLKEKGGRSLSVQLSAEAGEQFAKVKELLKGNNSSIVCRAIESLYLELVESPSDPASVEALISSFYSPPAPAAEGAESRPAPPPVPPVEEKSFDYDLENQPPVTIISQESSPAKDEYLAGFLAQPEDMGGARRRKDGGRDLIFSEEAKSESNVASNKKEADQPFDLNAVVRSLAVNVEESGISLFADLEEDEKKNSLLVAGNDAPVEIIGEEESEEPPRAATPTENQNPPPKDKPKSWLKKILRKKNKGGSGGRGE